MADVAKKLNSFNELCDEDAANASGRLIGLLCFGFFRLSMKVDKENESNEGTDFEYNKSESTIIDVF